MKLRNILTNKIYNKYGDMDVYNDCIDDFAPTWCGNTLTAYGYECYRYILDNLDADVVPDNYLGNGHHCIMVHINDLPSGTDERMWGKVVDMFYAMAGYIDEDEYDKMFEEPNYDEPKDLGQDVAEPRCSKEVKFGTIGWLKSELTTDRNVQVVDFGDAPNMKTVYVGNVKDIPDKFDEVVIQGYIPYPTNCTTIVI